jgi:hypothetical protein
VAGIEAGTFRGDKQNVEKVAFALDCRLAISFETFGRMPHELNTLAENPKSMIPVPFKYDPDIHAAWIGLRSFGADDGDRIALTRQLKDLFDENSAQDQKERIIKWVNGAGLPDSVKDVPGMSLVLALEGASPIAPYVVNIHIRQLLKDATTWTKSNYRNPKARLSADWTTHPLALRDGSSKSKPPIQAASDVHKAMGELLVLASQTQLFGNSLKEPVQKFLQVYLEKDRLPGDQSKLGMALGISIDTFGLPPRPAAKTQRRELRFGRN